jgi:hypothetical protein
VARYILRYTGKGPAPPEDILQLVSEGDARVVDTSSRMVLVEGSEGALQAAVEKLPAWRLSVEERSYPLPPPHPGAGKVEKPPGRVGSSQRRPRTA